MESSYAVQSTTNPELLEEFGKEIDELMRYFTFATNCAHAIPTVAGASLSENLEPLSELWMTRITHLLNTAMKNVIRNICMPESTVAQDASIQNYCDKSNQYIC